MPDKTTISTLNKTIKNTHLANPSFSVKINRLIDYNMITSLDVVVEPDDDGFIARNPDLPLFGYGDDVYEAIQNLKYEIESLYNDLMEDDHFTDDWLRIKSFLSKIIEKQ